MAADPRGVVQEGDEAGLHFGAGVGDVRAVERVGLPQLVGVGLGESEPMLALAIAVGLEQLEVLHQPREGVRRDLRAREHALLDA